MLSRGKKIAVISLAMGLSDIGIYTWYFQVGRTDIYAYIAAAVVLAGIYVYRDGELPELFYSSGRLTRDDDPSNLPPKLYLTILLAVTAIAVVAVFVGLRR